MRGRGAATGPRKKKLCDHRRTGPDLTGSESALPIPMHDNDIDPVPIPCCALLQAKLPAGAKILPLGALAAAKSRRGLYSIVFRGLNLLAGLSDIINSIFSLKKSAFTATGNLSVGCDLKLWCLLGQPQPGGVLSRGAAPATMGHAEPRRGGCCWVRVTALSSEEGERQR